jgi:hypothetical protein
MILITIIIIIYDDPRFLPSILDEFEIIIIAQ